MARRTWIKVRRGILDPKHRRSLGAAWHLYLYMLDRADWEDGIIYEWIDSAVADELEMNLVTLRFQRRHLETEGYIETSQNQYSQSIRITKYIDPREEINEGYSQGVNQGYNQGVNQGVNQGDININTPTMYSNNQISHNHINSSSNANPDLSEYVDEQKITTLLMNVTGNLHLSSEQIDYAVPAVRAIQAVHRDDTQSYLARFWDEWRARNYSRSNYHWLDWAVADEIPDRKGNKQKSFAERLAEA